MDLFEIIRKICIYTIPLVLAITLHELAHGYVAKLNGDNTAANAGRLTLNPISHVDLVGTILLPLGMLVLGVPFLFGWAQPVPINPNRFKNYRKGLRQVAVAGPLSNFLMLAVWAFVYVAIFHFSGIEPKSTFLSYLKEMSQFGISFNAILFIFNMIPIPPLDGSRIVDSFLKPQTSNKYRQLEPYGFLILLALLFFGFFRIIDPILKGVIKLVIRLFDSLFQLLM